MPALRSTPHRATVTWLGRVGDRAAGLVSHPADTLALNFTGVEGEAHSGLTRPACSRVSGLYPAATEIRNTRQLSIVSAEEIARIAAVMEVEAIDPGWLGASMVVSGIADFSHLPPSSRLLADSGACLVVDMENRPCVFPGKVIERFLTGKGKAFRVAAKGMRGITAWVEREGKISLGEGLTLFVPDQPSWAP